MVATRRAVTTALLLACTTLGTAVRADGPPREPTKSQLATARALFAKAQEDEDAGRWADALDKIRRASSVKATAGLRFHMALCEEKLGQLVAALSDYTAAESMARTDGNKDVLDLVGEPLAQIRSRVPNLTVNVDVKDAEVIVDGAPLPSGLWATPMPVEVGAHTVAAKAAGRTPFTATVNLAEHQNTTVDVRLPVAQPKPVEPVHPATAATEPGSAPARSSAAPDGGPLHGEAAPRSHTAAIVATAGAVALVGFGVAAFFVAGSNQSDAQSQCASRTTSCDDLKGPVHTWDTLALAGFIGGAAVGALAVVLWVRPPARAEGGVSATVGAGPGSLRIEGTF